MCTLLLIGVLNDNRYITWESETAMSYGGFVVSKVYIYIDVSIHFEINDIWGFAGENKKNC